MYLLSYRVLILYNACWTTCHASCAMAAYFKLKIKINLKQMSNAFNGDSTKSATPSKITAVLVRRTTKSESFPYQVFPSCFLGPLQTLLRCFCTDLPACQVSCLLTNTLLSWHMDAIITQPFQQLKACSVTSCSWRCVHLSSFLNTSSSWMTLCVWRPIMMTLVWLAFLLPEWLASVIICILSARSCDRQISSMITESR